MEGDDREARALVERFERGELRREALELLSLLGHADARRALGQLPLELTRTVTVRWPVETGRGRVRLTRKTSQD